MAMEVNHEKAGSKKACNCFAGLVMHKINEYSKFYKYCLNCISAGQYVLDLSGGIQDWLLI